MPMSKTEEALVFAAKNGNTKCFEKLYKLYYEKIYALALTVTKNASDAEDVLQITFVKAWQNIDKLNDPSAFSTWLQRITINQCNSMLRGSKQNYSIDDEGENGELLQIESDLMLPEQYAERADLSIRLKEIIDELSVVQRETILLYYFNDMSIEEIAQTMDCSEGTVKSRLFLARKAIKTEIEEQEKKTGEKFYGIAGVSLIPFAGMFIKQIKSASLSGSEAANVFNRISNTIFNTPLNPANVARLSDRAANAAQNTNAQPIQQVAESLVSSANTSPSIPVNAVSSASKSVFPLWAKIVSVVAGVGVLIGGGIFAWNKLKPAPSNPIIDAVVGDEFTYGKYEQDNNTGNGKENITWKVLERENDKLFVVSKYVLDCVTYEEYNPGFSWSDTGLRSSLDSDFYNNTFTDEEKKYISDAYVFSNEGSNSKKEDTVVIDKVFILNEYETDTYFSSKDERIAYATEYAMANGVETDKNNHAIWWLRSRAHENYIGAVYEDGNADGERGGHSGSSFGLRPAMWIDAKAMAENHDAENVVQPVDTRYLNDSLHNFLKTFALHFMDGTYDCENITEDSNILHGVIGESECVDYGLYSEELAVENSYDNWIDSREISSPIKEINDNRNPIYKKLDAPAVDNILTGIFHCTDDDIQKMRGWKSDWNPYGYADGYYYCSTGGHGDIGSEFAYKDGYYKDGCCYYSFDYYRSETLWTNNFSTEGISPSTTIYVKASLVAHEGKPWWSLYYYSQSPFSSNEPSVKSTGFDNYALYRDELKNHESKIKEYEHYYRNANYLKDNGEEVDTVAICDISGDTAPELLYFIMGEDISGNECPVIKICESNGGTIKELYTTSVDFSPSADVAIVMNSKTKEVYQFSDYQFADGGNTQIFKLTFNDHKVEAEEAFRYERRFIIDNTSGHSEYTYYLNSKEVNKETYETAFSGFESSIDSIILCCRTKMNFGEIMENLQPSSMTYNEALDYLDSVKSSTTASDSTKAQATTSETKTTKETTFSITQSEIDSEIEKIRTYYYSPSSGDTKKVIEKGQNNWNYSRDYRYHNGKLVFAFVFNGTEEHRLYFKDDHMIRYIDENHTTYDYPNTNKYSSWEKKVLAEAY